MTREDFEVEVKKIVDSSELSVFGRAFLYEQLMKNYSELKEVYLPGVGNQDEIYSRSLKNILDTARRS